ncbi:phage baseplate assembly protein V [Herbaspirillum lusitanum]|uniref:phage baseplate assembly protein V n=1 Tax=Herbaspirillum lusitanum TaxID=213312 RepID=UPI002238388E|nr:phage baseplate assembly protein V [Herbaspirillum lusitanum]MCW5300863.1 phage baseplate assembly protein V [Herbaspirillum lusitanum]
MSKQTMMRRARMRGLVDSKVQKVRVDVFDNLSRETVERLQDYGFAAAPTEGEGLVISIGGHMMVLRMDQIGSRPPLTANEVAVWHKDGHNIKLTDGKKIVIKCDEYIIDTKKYSVTAPDGISMDSPTLEATGKVKGATLDIAGTGKIDGVDVGSHDHGGVKEGEDRTDGPSKS